MPDATPVHQEVDTSALHDEEGQSHQLHPRTPLLWQVENGVLGLGVVLAVVVVRATSVLPDAWDGWVTALGVAALVLTIVDAVLLIPRRYRYYRYTLTRDTLLVEQGRIWRRRRAYPLSRVLYSEARQGPVLRAFGLFSLRAATIVEAATVGPLGRAEAERFERVIRERSP